MIDESRGSHLVPPSANRRTLAKMQGKLANSGKAGRKMDLAQPGRARRPVRIWPFVVALGLALAGMHFALNSRQDRIDQALAGLNRGGARLEPPPGLALDEQARFWCYAVYDFPKLKSRFKLPKAVVYDKREARANLDRILAENLGNEVRREVFAYQQAAPDPRPAPPRAAAKPAPKPARRK